MANLIIDFLKVAMPRLDTATRNIAIGRFQAEESQNEVARTLNVNQSTISRLWNIFQQTGSTNKRQRSGRPRITTPGQRSIHPNRSSTESNRSRINHCSRNTWIAKNQFTKVPQPAWTA